MSLPSPAALRESLEALPPGYSVARYLVELAGSREQLYRLFGRATDAEIAALATDLYFWARREQLPPAHDDWDVLAIIAGRGFGKTWTGTLFCTEMARRGKEPGALIAATEADYRDTMIEGPSGLLAQAPPDFKPRFVPSKRRVVWPNGVYAQCYSADKPDRMRGPNTGWAWADELTSWSHDLAAYDQIGFFNRIGKRPKVLVTTTPKPLKKFREILYGMREEDQRSRKLLPGIILRTGSSFDNAANLAESTLARWRQLEGTELYRQELLGELLLDAPSVLFAKALPRMVAGRIRVEDVPGWARAELERRIVAVDPAQSSGSKSDEHAIIVEGSRTMNGFSHVYVLADRSCKGTPNEWATAAVRAAVEFSCDAVVAEVNTGGEMVESTIRTAAQELGVAIEVVSVRAREKKSKRAEPVAMLGEVGRIHLVNELPKLENQLERFSGVNGRRDDRADAMCWGVHHLALDAQFFAFY